MTFSGDGEDVNRDHRYDAGVVDDDVVVVNDADAVVGHYYSDHLHGPPSRNFFLHPRRAHHPAVDLLLEVPSYP